MYRPGAVFSGILSCDVESWLCHPGWLFPWASSLSWVHRQGPPYFTRRVFVESSILRHLCLQDVSKVVLHVLARITLLQRSSKDAWPNAQVGTSAGKSFPRKCLKAILFWVSWSHHFVWGWGKPYVAFYWMLVFFFNVGTFFLFQFLPVLWSCWL